MKRQNTNMLRHKILVIVALFFLLTIIFGSSGCAIQKENSAGQVNGVYIEKDAFLNSLRGHFTGFEQENERTPTETEKQEIYQTTWKDITTHIILREYFKKYGIQVTQQELLDTLTTNIPSTIKNAQVYQRNGHFDKSLYMSDLTSTKSKELDWLKQYYFNYYIPIAKLKIALQKGELLTKKETKHLSEVLNTKADIDWIVFDPALREAGVSQAEVESYYQSHLKEFQVRRFADIGWVELPVKINSEDETQARTKIDSIYFEITNGKPFESMAERYSQASSADNGGALGFVKFADLPVNVKTALADLDTGSVTHPLIVGSDWIIYQLVERTTNLVKLNELVLNIAPGEKNKNSIKDKALRLKDLALQLGLKTAAGEMNLPYHESGKVNSDSVWIADNGIGAYLIDRAYTQAAGAILEPVYSRQLQSWILAVINDVQPFEIKPLLAVNDEIRAKLLQHKQLGLAYSYAANWAAAHKKNQVSEAEKDKFSVISTPGMDIYGSLDNTPILAIYQNIIDTNKAKKAQQPYRLGERIVLPVVNSTSSANPPLLATQELSQFYFTNLHPDWFDSWLNQQLRKAVVKKWFTYP